MMSWNIEALRTGGWRAVVDFITPSRCLACRTPLGEPASLCTGCWLSLSLIDDPLCNVTGTPFAYDQGDGTVSAAALADPPPWDRARAAVAFDEASRPIVHALKFHDTQEAGLLMTRMMARSGHQLLTQADIVMPVPLHPFRLWQRRFNQSSYLALRLAAGVGRPCDTTALHRVKRTRAQVGLDGPARKKNVRGAFAVPPEALARVDRRRILLVDDVLTTGATAGACATALRQAGVAGVDVLTFAIVLAPRRLSN
jgi:ComF family protein